MERRLALCFALLFVAAQARPAPAAQAPPAERPQFSGVYPHLAALTDSFSESGIGAVVPWAGKLWFVTYVAHKAGSGAGLFEVGSDLSITRRPESIVGTHACRMIHRESNQLLIGPYLIDAEGHVRVLKELAETERLTAVFRHLTDPANKVYYLAMEGSLYEADVRTLETKKLFDLTQLFNVTARPHFKGGYTAQGRVVVANNSYDGRDQESRAGSGRLAEWDGKTWTILERTAFCDVTTANGVHAVADDRSPLYATGWDRRSVILKVLTNGAWSTYRLPKGNQSYDNWVCTEWPRIRMTAPGRLLFDMHGLFYDMAADFHAGRAGGLSPIAQHLKMIPDFCTWQGRLVCAGDDNSSMQGRHETGGQPQSNLWFGRVEELRRWGKPAGWGGPWLGDAIKRGVPSDPFLIGGFTNRSLHVVEGSRSVAAGDRCTGAIPITRIPEALAGLDRVSIARGEMKEPGRGYSFTIDRDAVVYMAVQERGDAKLPAGWEKTDLTLEWEKGGSYTDAVYRRAFAKGVVEIPPHLGQDDRLAYGVPHLCFVQPARGGSVRISSLPEGIGAQVTPAPADAPPSRVLLTMEIDRDGTGKWRRYGTVEVRAGGYAERVLPDNLAGCWMRLTADRDCTGSVQFILGPRRDAAPGEPGLFAALPRVGEVKPRIQGAVLPWANRLWCTAYTVGPDGRAQGSGPYEVDEAMRFTRRAESVPGVFANRLTVGAMLSIGPHLVDERGNVRTIAGLEGQHLTATIRHPDAGRMYLLTVEGRLLEADLKTLAVQPAADIPEATGLKGTGLRFKGGHLDGKTIIVAASAPDGKSGCLVEGDGREWRVIDRAAYGEVMNLGSMSQVTVATGWDAASAILKMRLNNAGMWATYRFPKASPAYDTAWGDTWPRVREIITERLCLDLGGIFYDMSALSYAWTIRPVGTHGRLISDYCTWRGLLVLAGCDAGAPAGGNHVRGGDGVGLWFGKQDDLWQLDKPAGRGGPWLDTPVQAGKPSDPYLMLGFEEKEVSLSHDGAEPVEFEIQVDAEGTRRNWRTLQRIRVQPGGPTTYRFPEGYSAHWVRVQAGRDCRATAQLTYGR